MPSFADQIRKIAAKRMQDANAVFANTAFQLGNEVIVNTPVDEGTAIGSWVPSINTASSDIPERTKDEAVSNLAQTINSLKLGDTFYLVSNLEYMAVLEYGLFPTGNAGSPDSKVTPDGFSKKSSSGWIRTAADNVQNAVNEEVKNVR